MATLHPSEPLGVPATRGLKREHDVLRLLRDGLSDDYDVFHSLDWSVLFDNRQLHGEIDVAVVAPNGHIVLLEIKAGPIVEREWGMEKHYCAGKTLRVKDVGHQVRRMYAALRTRLGEALLDRTIITTMLVLPDHQAMSSILAFPGDRVVDSFELEKLPYIVRQANAHAERLSDDARQRILAFLGQMLDVVPDVATRIGQLRTMSTSLSSGLATWVPKIEHAENAFVIDATAGSGKTQLAVRLLNDGQGKGRNTAYVCFNRPLADHLSRIAPTATEVRSFHELCVIEARRAGIEPRFDTPGVFDVLAARWAEHAASQTPRWDLLVIDEAQDLAPEWIQTLLNLLKPDGKVYLMGDSQQSLYERDAFRVPNAVTIRCQDNFRSPRAVVDAINRLRLLPEPIQARSAFQGEPPGFSTYAPDTDSLIAVEDCLQRLMQDGIHIDDIALLSYAGQQRSQLLKQEMLAGIALRKPTGQYDRSGQPVWTHGTLQADTLYRFKGQSAPVVVLCEIDFEQATERDLRLLFVGLTRAQYRVECVLSERAAAGLMKRIDDDLRYT